MAVLTTAAFLSKWNSMFADNSGRAISEADMREFVADIKDSFVSVVTGGVIGSWKDPCQLATTSNITLSGEQTIDGILTSSSRVLVREQSSASQNGIYVTGAGAWTRATDADASAEIEGAAVGVTQGGTYANTVWLQTSDSVSVGVSAIEWQQIGFGVANQSLYQVLSEGNSAFGLTIEDVADPVNDQDVATRAWVLANVSTTLPDLEIEEVTATSYNFVAADRFKIKMFTNVAGCTATVPVGLDQGWAVAVYRPTGAGTLTLASAGTYRGLDTTLGTEETWATITHIGSDIHAASGALGNLGLSIGTIDSQTKSANGGVLSGSSLYFQTADATYPGLLSLGAQTIMGVKTFTNGLVTSGNVGIGLVPTATLDVLRGTAANGAAVIRGTDINCFFNYSTAENTYIRGGKSASHVYVNDSNAGNVYLGGTGGVYVVAAPSTSNTGNSILARNSTTGVLELRSDVVVTSGAQTIAGVKTFSSTPILSSAPSTSNSANAIVARNTSTGALELRSDVLYASATTVGNVGTGVDTLYTFSVPANTFNADGTRMMLSVGGSFATNGNTKTIKVTFGGVDLFSLAQSTATWKWMLTLEIYRSSSTTVKAMGRFSYALAGQPDSTVSTLYATGTVTLSSIQTLSVTGEATTTNDIVAEFCRAIMA